jgi:hypothetical protein
MSLLAAIVVTLTAAVVIAIFLVLWHARTSARQSWIAIVSGLILASWAFVAALLARRGFFQPPDLASPPLRGLLTNQRHLILLNLWRLVGVVFLALMANGQMPAFWALPAGIGDVIVGAAAPWIARHVEAPGGKRRAMIFSLFGMADLVVAVGLGVMTNPGPAQVFRTRPTSELAQFPLALVPTFLVPLAFVLHVISLWQLLGGTWALQPVASSARGR